MYEITAEVLDFWFGKPEDNPDGKPQSFWFKSTPELDAEIRARFFDVHKRASEGAYDDSAETSDDHLALVLIFDQFPRNMFRGTADMYMTDPNALDWANKTIKKGLDLEQPAPNRRMFLYLPFEHSENLADQERAVELIGTLGDDEYTRYARMHRDVIAELGRFPHRNALLGRESTAEEDVYLSQPGAGF